MLTAGVARTCLTPFWGVELTGWGYYIERRWQRVHDDLHATCLAVDDGQRQALLLTVDLMVVDSEFTRSTRAAIEQVTGLSPQDILITCSHSHNAPAAGGLRGVGACDPLYEAWASRQAATAAILAWQRRVPAVLRVGQSDVTGLTFNRTRPNGVVDPTLTVMSLDRLDGEPLAVVVNFGGHPTLTTDWRPFDVSRDLPGLVCDRIEQQFPSVTAMYVQGACGDVNFLREYIDEQRHHEPAQYLARVAVEALNDAPVVPDVVVRTASLTAKLPTRRWTRDEIAADRSAAMSRIQTREVAGWRETIGRSMTNRPDDMVRRHGGDELKAVLAMARFHDEWTSQILEDWATRPEFLETEVQALRIGPLAIASNASEFFSPFALDLRRICPLPHLMIACYANGRIGYLPDAHDIQARSYAGFQSPKYCNQFPFTPESGPAMVAAMGQSIAHCLSDD